MIKKKEDKKAGMTIKILEMLGSKIPDRQEEEEDREGQKEGLEVNPVSSALPKKKKAPLAPLFD